MLQNGQLAEELHKPIIKKFLKRRVYFWGADLADMQLISKFKKETKFFFMCHCYF